MPCPFAQTFTTDELKERAAIQTGTNGNPVVSNITSMSVGPRGPLVYSDIFLFDKLAAQNRERIPERTVHAKGWGLQGVFKVTHDITKYTKAKLFSEIGKETEIISRWSLVAGERGAADAERDVRGFALKFYTEEGNWDLVGNNTPIFFLRDPMLFPDFIHTQKRNPLTNIRSPDAQFDFWGSHPESIHQVLWLFGDRGLPLSPMHMDGFGSHTFSMINAENERVWVKFHMKTQQGIKWLSNDEAAEVIGRTRESYQEQLIDAIAEGRYPKWTMFIQVMTDDQAKKFRWNPFDITKTWPHAEFPLIQVGELTFNRIPSNHHQFIEQLALAPSSLVPGISISPDKMLQGRLLSYPDAHRYRLGVNFDSLPPNIPKRCPLGFTGLDGVGRTHCPDNGNPDAYYDQSRFGPPRPVGIEDPPFEIEPGSVIARHVQEVTDLDYEQPRALWERVFDAAAQQRMCDNMAAPLSLCSDVVVNKWLAQLAKVSKSLRDGVEKAVAAKRAAGGPAPFRRFLAAEIPADKIGPRIGFPGSAYILGDARVPPVADVKCPDLAAAKEKA